MKQFLGEDFLLTNKVAEELYHNHAAKMPIIDYHNHLPTSEIASNRQYDNLTQAWLEGDHYKWRAMRANGVEEKYITGNASHEEKFLKWASCVPFTLRNPLYHWTHLELRRYFGISDLLDSKSAKKIYEQTSELLSTPERSCQGLLAMKEVKLLCTTDDPIDDLEDHKTVAALGFQTIVLPTFRPEKAISLSDLCYIERLGDLCAINIKSADDIMQALSQRIDYFHEYGCRLADISFESLPILSDTRQAELAIKKLLEGQDLTLSELENAQAYLLIEVCKLYHAKGWTQQFHIGVIRNTNSRMYMTVGGDAGFDTMSDPLQAKSLVAFLDALDRTDQLTQTILYNLNPRDNDLFATMTSNFQTGAAGKIQFGSGWWFLDQKQGIENQINALSNMGLLSRFIGMLTDSRSFLSFSRHEYFRRILCNMVGADVSNGELPYDMELLGDMVENICYHNAVNYLKLG